MKIASWNVNSVKARLPILRDWLAHEQPDILLIQEIKCESQAFPSLEFSSLGYQAHAVGQKSYNGVAVLARVPFDVRGEHLPGENEDTQARYLEIEARGVIIGNLYAPNGNPVDSAKFPYKLRWLERLHSHAAALFASARPVVLIGDYNIIPEPEDCWDANAWTGDALFRPEARAAWRQLLNIGYVDALRAIQPVGAAYSFWDYQQSAFLKDWGIRIDHALLSPEAADRLQCCWIDKQPRGLEQPSDHTPLVVELG